MKEYNKPSFQYVALNVEERFAGGSPCTVKGSCTEENIEAFEARFGVTVNNI